jgi:hypothetical protein
MNASEPPEYGEWEKIGWLHYVWKLQSLPTSWKNDFYRRRYDGGWVYNESQGLPPPVLISSQDRRKAKDHRFKGENRRRLG